MTPETVITIAEEGIWMVLLICGPLLILALVVGLIVSIFQATTQIQEQTLAFVPKIVAVLLGLMFLWSMDVESIAFLSTDIFSNLTRFIG